MIPMASQTIVPYTKQTALGGNSSIKKRPQVYVEPPSKCKQWLSKLESTLRWRQHNYDKNWKRAYNMYNGAHWRDKMETDPSSDMVSDRITVNITMSTVLNVVPFLLNNKPKFVCKPRRKDKDKVAKLQAEVLNYEYEQREIHNQVKKAVYDCVIVGHGIVKVGYVLELDEPKGKKYGKAIQFESYIKEDSPYAKRICPFYFLIDPCASENNLETAEWCGEILFQTKRNICGNTRYNPSVIKKIEEGHYNLVTKSTYFNMMSDANTMSGLHWNGSEVEDDYVDMDETVVLFELWDKRERKYYILAPGVEEPLLEKDWPFDYIDNFPYLMVNYIPIQDDIYGVGIPYTIEDQQFELNRIRTSAFEHRRRFNRKYQAVENQISTQEANKLVNGPDGTVVFVKQMGAIAPIAEANLQQDNIQVEAMIKGDIGQMTGNDDLISGRALPSRTTQGEIQTRTSLYRLKLDDRADAIDKFVLNVGKQVLQHIKNNYRTERVVGLVGLDGINWETLTTTDIKEEVDVMMESLAAAKTDESVDRQQRVFVWEKALQGLPLVQAGILKLDYNNLFAWMMEAFGYKDIGRFFDFDLVVQPPLQPVDGTQNNSVNNQINPLTSPQGGDIMQSGGNNIAAAAMNGAFNFGY